MKPSVDRIRHCLDSGIPSSIATCAADGTPNVTFVSQVEYLDDEHVALTFQFFNKTRENILARPRALLYVTQGETGESYRLSLQYLRTENEGPLFERMKARLAGIASHTGMSGIFRLRGSDVYRVLDIETVDGVAPLPAPPRRNLLAALNKSSTAMAACTDLGSLLDETLAQLRQGFGIAHALLLVHDRARGRLYTVASTGYRESGIGSEIAFGEGVIGVAAQQRTPIRIAYMTNDYGYSRAVRDTVQRSGFDELLRTEIPFPGLAEPQSQLAVPILAGGELLGVLYAESPDANRYGYDDEDALVTLAAQLGAMARLLQEADEPEPVAAAPMAPAPATGAELLVRRYAENDSIFIGDQYLIKGVAGCILWRMLGDYLRDGRNEFSNRELRLDPALKLPDFSDNLEARLTLLNRRLGERCDALALHKIGRGRFRLDVRRPLRLVDIPRA
ncbi:MAG: GAF domain-containing protein [Nevskiaceae bacterium]|nr:MAG: GAF domain-containing protein [Nevskiaceae bacterium]